MINSRLIRFTWWSTGHHNLFLKKFVLFFGRLERKSQTRHLFTGLSGVCMCVCVLLVCLCMEDVMALLVMFQTHKPGPIYYRTIYFQNSHWSFPLLLVPVPLFFSIFQYYWRVKFDFSSRTGSRRSIHISSLNVFHLWFFRPDSGRNYSVRLRFNSAIIF